MKNRFQMESVFFPYKRMNRYNDKRFTNYSDNEGVGL